MSFVRGDTDTNTPHAHLICLRSDGRHHLKSQTRAYHTHTPFVRGVTADVICQATHFTLHLLARRIMVDYVYQCQERQQMSFIHDDLCVGQESHRKLCLPMSPLSLLSLCTERAEYCLAFPALFYYASCTLSIERKERHAHTHTQRQKKTDRQTVKTERQSVRRIDSQTDRFKNTRKHARTNTHTHTHAHTHSHTHTRTYTKTLTHTYTYTHM